MEDDFSTDDKPTIHCDTFMGNHSSGVAIICAPTGILCTAQVGGNSCFHPHVEGFPVVLTLGGSGTFDDCSWGCNNNLLDDDLEVRHKYAKAIDDFLTENINGCIWETIVFEFDYERIKELTEGWWPVLATLKNCGFCRKEEYYKQKFKAYLHFGNCD